MNSPEERIAPRTLAAIFAAAAAFVGQSIELKSVHELHGVEQSDRWQRLGRAAVHNAHNLVHARRLPGR
jgi:hypothetical protein